MRIGCDIASIAAVAEVESAGAGFLPDGRVKILYEPPIFARYSGGRFSTSHPNISRRYRLTSGQYGSYSAQWDKFTRASALDYRAAVYACSWGKFQLMGFNHAICGYPTLEDWVTAMSMSEGEHLQAFVGFVLKRGLADELRYHDWTGFAYGYNGPAFDTQDYDGKLAAAYAAAAQTYCGSA